MYLSPLTIKARTCPCYICWWTCGESNAGLARLFHTHCTFFVNVLMISQNIKFKPIYKRSKTFTLPLWVANPLRLCNRLRTKVKTWLNLLQ